MPPEYATKQKVDAGFQAVAERLAGFEDAADDIKTLRQNIDVLGKTLNSVKRYGLAFRDNYAEGKGFFGNEELARTFGVCVLKALGKSSNMVTYFDKDLFEGEPSAGGVTVPEDVSRRFIDMLGKYGRFRKRVTVLPIKSGQASVPRLTADLSVEVPGEGKPVGKSSPAFDAIKLAPKSWLALCAVSKELDDDSVLAVGEIVAISIARSMARQEDRVGFLGDGSETFYGMTGVRGKLLSIDPDPAQIPGIHIGTGTGWSGLTLDDFESVDALLPEDAEDEACWFVSKAFYTKVMRKLAATTAASAMFDLLSDKRGRYFNGYPVEFVSCMPRVSGNGQICAILGNLQLGAYLAERRQLGIERSDHAFFSSYQVGLLGVERIDINVFGCGDKTNPGSIVALMTGSSGG